MSVGTCLNSVSLLKNYLYVYKAHPFTRILTSQLRFYNNFFYHYLKNYVALIGIKISWNPKKTKVFKPVTNLT